MVMSVLGLALAAGADYPSAIRLANVAGGLEVEKIGVATVTREEILNDLIHAPILADPHAATSKLRTIARLVTELDVRRRSGQRVAFTNGCFDILHAGHVQYLNEARARDRLPGRRLNTDASVRRAQGTGPASELRGRPGRSAGRTRRRRLPGLFDDPTPIELIKAIKPDVLVKGSDYRKEQVVGADLVESYGGRVTWRVCEGTRRRS